MPTPVLNSSLVEYSFTEEEYLLARQLTSLQIFYFQTKYALLLKEKAASLLPSSADLDRDFLLRIASLDGKLDMLQELLQDASEASKLAQKQVMQAGQEVNSSYTEIKDLATRASQQVHQQN